MRGGDATGRAGGDAPFPEMFWVEQGHALIDDTALFPQPGPPLDPPVGDLAGPVNAPLPEPEPKP